MSQQARVNRVEAGAAGGEEEEEEIFLDTVEENGASPELPAPRRSARTSKKRKSESDQTPDQTNQNFKGKRPRPLGTMHRTPDSGKPQTRQKAPAETPGAGTTPTVIDLGEEESGKQQPETMVLLGGIRTLMREELAKTEERIGGRIGTLEKKFTGLQDHFESLEARVTEMDGLMEDKIGDMISDRLEDKRGRLGGDRSLCLEQPANPVMSSQRDQRYWKARKSLRIWPVRGPQDEIRASVGRFLSDKLKLPEEVVEEAAASKVARVPASSKSKVTCEVTVEFPSVHLRDIVRKSAFNLAGDREAGIRLEIPHHLMNNFKALEAASYRLKLKHENLKRIIKYDDEMMDLVLDFKIGAEAWRRLKPCQARELQKSDGGVEEVSAADMTDLLK